MDPLHKSNLILTGLVLLLGAPTFFVLKGESELFTSLDQVPRMFEGFTADNVGALVIGEPKPNQPEQPAQPEQLGPDGKPIKKPVERDVLQFNRADKGWVLGAGELQGAPVQTLRIENDLLEHLGKIRVDRQTLVARDASDELLDQFGLTEEKAFVLRAVDRTMTQSLAELFVGRDASGGNFGTEAVRGFFVRKADSRDVVLYEVQGWRRGLKAAEWVDTKVHQIDPTKITRFSLRNPATEGLEMVFDKKPGSAATWIASAAPEGVGAPRQAELEKLVQRFLYIQATEFRMPLQRANLGALGLSPARIEISATVKDGDTEKIHRLSIGEPIEDKPNEVYLTSSDSPFLMSWGAYMVTPFESDPKTLFDPPADVPPKDGDKEEGAGKGNGGR